MDLGDKFKGALLGTAIGDSLGHRLEGIAPLGLEGVKRILPRVQELRYSDDTQMMTGVAESLIDCKGFDGEHMARRFVENYNQTRGYGPGCTQVLKRIKEGDPWDAPARELFDGSGSYGNGSAMRAAPIGVLYCDAKEFREVACESSRITHTHELGIEGAALQAFAVSLSTIEDPRAKFSVDGFLKELESFTQNEVYSQKLGKVRELLKGKPTELEVVGELGNGIEAFNSVPIAIYSFLTHPKSFEEALFCALGFGGDSDTIGAMTGAISGAYNGGSSIPADWKERLEDGEKISRLAEKLFSLYLLKLLGERCEFCFSRERVHPFKIDPKGENDIPNFMILCPRCHREVLRKRPHRLPARPRKRGKYRGVYRKAFRRRM